MVSSPSARGRAPHVIAIDIDAPVLGRARFPDVPVTWCRGDVLIHPLEQEPFDAVLSNAALHHLPDARAAPPEPAGAARRNAGKRPVLAGCLTVRTSRGLHALK